MVHLISVPSRSRDLKEKEQGCDASILLGDGNSIGERRKGVIANDGLQQGALQLIENIRSNAHAQSQQCRDTVSCADILALATAEAVRQAGGPEFSVPVGRLDSLAPASDGDMGKLPRPFDDLGELKRRFGGKQLSDVDLVALSGAHTVGRARCKTFRDRTNSPKDNFAWGLRHFCSGPNSDERAHDLDATPVDFDNRYFVDLSRRKEERKGVLTSDVVLADDGSSLKWLVDLYARDQGRFFTDFGNSMRKLSLMSWRKPNEGEIRKHGCFRTNSGRFDVPHHLAAAA